MLKRVCVLAFVSYLGAMACRAADRPNIVLIYADDLGYGDVAATAPQRSRRPNIDRLAQRGFEVHRRSFRFSHVHAVALRPANRGICLAKERDGSSCPGMLR